MPWRPGSEPPWRCARPRPGAPPDGRGRSWDARDRARAGASTRTRHPAGSAVIPAHARALGRRRAARASLEEGPQLFQELIQVLEVPVDGGEPHVGDLVQMVQLAHEPLADLARVRLILA